MRSLYNLEKAFHQSSTRGYDGESSPLLTEHTSDPDVVFTRALDTELEKIASFYQVKELEIYGEVEDLLRDEEDYVAESGGIDGDILENGNSKHPKMRSHSIFRSSLGLGGRLRRGSTVSASISNIEEEEDSDDEDEADETAALRGSGIMKRSKTTDQSYRSGVDSMQSSRELPSRNRKASVGTEDFSEQALQALYNSGITLKKRTISHYVSLCELKSFIQLNKTGFSKALKKYDKTLNRKLKSRYIEDKVNPAYPFQPSTTSRLEDYIRRTEKIYADVVTKGDVDLARKELRLHLREHVVWERNTVWREMIGIERKAQAANLGIRQTLLGGTQDKSDGQKQGDEIDLEATKEVSTPIGKYTCPRWLFSTTFFTLLALIAVFAMLLVVPIMKSPEQQNCLAMLIFVSLLWATEVSYIETKARAMLTIQGHTSFRHFFTYPLPSCCPPSHVLRRRISPKALRKRSNKQSVRSNVDSCDYATLRRLHYCRRTVQISYRQADGYSCP